MATLGTGVELRPTRWVVLQGGDALERDTCAYLRFVAGGANMTRSSDDFSASITDDVLVSLYPLSMWLASSWWRILFEPRSLGPPSTEWRMSHDLRSAGAGYLWPIVRIVPEGDSVVVSSIPSRIGSKEPIRFLDRTDLRFPRSEVEGALASFIDIVVARLVSRGHIETELAALWAEVQAERSDPVLSKLRRREAMLGFDPDGAPVELLEGIAALEAKAGHGAAEELAAANRGDQSAGWIRSLEAALTAEGIHGKVANLSIKPPPSGAPWTQGFELAREVRSAMSLKPDEPVANEALARLLGIPAAALEGRRKTPRVRVGLGVRKPSDEVELLFRRKQTTSRRFEAARFVADALLNPSDKWLPSTDAETARQKRQRSFAAELLSPISTIVGRLKGDYSLEAVEDFADEMQVGSTLVLSQLANNGLIGPEDVPGNERPSVH